MVSHDHTENSNPPDSGSTPAHQKEMTNISVNKKVNVFDVEWRGKVDILTLKITEKNRYPLKVYGKAG